jgi:amphiphysin
VTRLPHMVLQKAGAVDETKDTDFNVLTTCFERTSANTERLLEDLKKYRVSVMEMLEHQREVLEAFLAVLEMEEGLRSSTVVSSNISLITSILDSLQRRRNEILDELEASFTNRALKILEELLVSQRGISAKITKRNHKLVDFDRHRHSLKKFEADKSKSISDERKMVKTENLLSEAEEEYLKYNEQLKEDLPVYLRLHAKLIQPILEGVIRFQKLLFRAQRDSLSDVAKLESTDYSAILKRYEDEVSNPLLVLNEIPMLQAMTGRVKRQTSLSISDRSTTPSSPAKKDIPLRSMNNDLKSPRVPSVAGPPLRSTNNDLKSPRMPSAVDPPEDAQSDSPPKYIYTEIHPAAKGNRVSELASKLNNMNVSTPTRGKTPPALPTKIDKVKALYDYVGQEGDLSFVEGDEIEVLKRTDKTEDWWTGRLNGKTGLFPGNYVTK